MRPRQIPFLLTLLALVILLAGSLAMAKTIFVSESSTASSEDGTLARPFRTITSALGNSASGDVVQVMPGDYEETISIPSGVQVLSTDGALVTTIDGRGASGTVTIFSSDPNTKLDGFTITGGRALSGGGVFIFGLGTISNNTISGNRVVGSFEVGSQGGGIAVSGSAVIQGNTIFANTALVGQGGGIAVTGGAPVITRNTIMGNSAFAAQDGFLGYGGGIATLGTSVRPVITSNIIQGNRADQGGGGLDIYRNQSIIAGNTISGNLAGLRGRAIGHGGGIQVTGQRGAIQGTAPIIINNLVLENRAQVSGGGVDVLFARPFFRSNNFFGNTPVNFRGRTNPVGGDGNVSIDPNLPAGSFVPDSGFSHIDDGHDGLVSLGGELSADPNVVGDRQVLNSADLGTLDFLGRPRTLDGDSDGVGRPDIGANEYVPGTDLAGAAMDDLDGDGVLDLAPDNCPAVYNPSDPITAAQADADADLMGDPCDICPAVYNPADPNTMLQPDADRDLVGDECDADLDNDAVLEDGSGSGVAGDEVCVGRQRVGCDDNCPDDTNGDQRDRDRDGVGNTCDNCDFRRNGACGDLVNLFCDRNRDGTEDSDEILMGNQADGDADRVGDACDNCPLVPNGNCTGGTSVCDIDGDETLSSLELARGFQSDRDDDGVGDACEIDLDRDQVPCALDPNGRVTCDMPCVAGQTTGCHDNCPTTRNASQSDSDGDGAGDACDNCSDLYNPGQENSNFDREGDECDTDDDGDGALDDGEDPPSGILGDNPCPGADPNMPTAGCDDNCRTTFNASQADQDDDGVGDACELTEGDGDVDGDGIPPDFDSDPNTVNRCTGGTAAMCDDNCPSKYNPAQADTDGDLAGDDCDNCPALANLVANMAQPDLDSDGIGDACDTDLDGDEDPNAPVPDNCPLNYNPAQTDDDTDALGNDCDNCDETYNPGQEDLDSDGVGDACDKDDDGDGIPDLKDNCPTASDPMLLDMATNPLQTDQDNDGLGDTCDPDDDGDGALDGSDNCPDLSNVGQADGDGDGIGDACDRCPADNDPVNTDTDGDGVGDACDNCLEVFNPGQKDDDSDGTGNACDTTASS